MKVAFIVSHFPILSETFVLNQIAGLIDRGHEVDIYSTNRGDTAKLHPDVERYSLLERTYYPPPVPRNFLKRLITGIALTIPNISKDPRRLINSINIFKYRKAAASLCLLYMAIPALGKEPYDIIHCQFGTLSHKGIFFRIINSPMAKVIISFRGFDISKHVKQQGEHCYDKAFKLGDFFLTNCNFFRERMIKLGCDENKAIVLGSGLDCSLFTFTPRYPPTDSRIRLVTTGRLVEKKGIEYGIRAVAKLIKTHPNVEYNIIGDGELRPSLQNLIHQLNVGDNVRLLGWKQQDELIEILDHSHILIAPCVTASDGNQDAPVNALKEAMAMGLPVIGTYHGGIPELIEDGISGFLVPERDADALAERLSYLIEHSQIWPDMGRAGRAYVERHYNLSALNDRLVEIYHHLLDHDNPGLNSRESSPYVITT